jgi:hypothetical protein
MVLPQSGTGSQLAVSNLVTTVQAAGHTIRGKGQINGPGTLVNNGTVAGLSSSEMLDVNAILAGDGLIRDVFIDGVHSPGNPQAGSPTASVPIEGEYNFGNGPGINFDNRLVIEIGGTTPGDDYDQLVSTDASNHVTIRTVGTTLDVSLIDSFVPSAGDMFTLISTAGTITGDFATENLPSSAGGNGLTWAVHYNASDLILEVLSVGLPGDFNEDGKVDAADYVVWRKNDSANNPLPNDNGLTTQAARFNLWRGNFGAMAGGGSGSASAARQVGVPEPAAAPLIVAAAIAAMVVSKRRPA